jgi:hypothetical protein
VTPALPPVSCWPPKVYEAFPAGRFWEKFFNVLTVIKEPLPPTEGMGIFDRSFAAKAFNTIYDRTEGLIVIRAMVSCNSYMKLLLPKFPLYNILGRSNGLR